jgi:poly [ADP-ribose] polymerase
MLCDVALGNMYERYHADYVEKLPKGMHSCKGVGKTEPDPKEFADLNGAKVPFGKGVTPERFTTEKNLRSDLLYNEYIVYDVAQVKSQYLLRVKFNYKI